MLKRLHIQNFQSHKSTTIDFTNGLNVIIGESDGGKSSIIRAISAVCYNTWDSDSMRVGETCCTITLQTDKGIVTLIKDTKNKINAYKGIKFQNNEQFSFESVGVTVPQIVNQITGISPLKIADSNVDIPNIMYQLDKHYMLAQVSGKSCTSNLIARIFDKVIGLGGMQELISQISSSMINDKKQITKKMSQVDQFKNNLFDQQLLIEKQNNIKIAKRLKKEIEENNKNLEKLQFFIDNYENLNQKLKQVDSKYLDLDVNFIKKTMEEIFILQKKLTSITDVYTKSIVLTNELKQCQDVIQRYKDLKSDDIEIIKNIYNKINNAQKQLNRYNDLKNELRNVQQIIDKYKQLDQSESILQYVKKTCNKLYVADKLITKLEQKKNLLKELDFEIQLQSKKYNEYSNELKKIKKENKVCPLCGNLFQNCLQNR